MSALPWYLWICFVTAFVCTGVKEDEPRAFVRGTAHLFATIGGGILLFAGVVQVLCLAVLP